MKSSGLLASLILVTLLGVLTTVAASEFYAGEEATGLEQQLFATLDTVSGPVFVGLIFLLFVAFIGSLVMLAGNSVSWRAGGGR